MSSGDISHRQREGVFSAVAAGFFLVLVGLLFVINTNLGDKVIAMFKDVTAVNVTNSNVILPAPAHPADYLLVYTAVEQFSIIWGAFLVAMLGLRFTVGAPTRKKAENLSDIIFWFGTAYLTQTWLINMIPTAGDPIQTWFEFWALILMLLGVSLIVRAVFLAIVGATRRH